MIPKLQNVKVGGKRSISSYHASDSQLDLEIYGDFRTFATSTAVVSIHKL